MPIGGVSNKKAGSRSVYVATNLLETMVEKTEPTRAEIHDVVRTLEDGAAGLVLAAEAAIGLNPPNCVRILSNLISEVNNKPEHIEQDFLFENPPNNIVPPHGGRLVSMHLNDDVDLGSPDLLLVNIDEKVKSDVIQIANGVYSPLDRFMNLEELSVVLSENRLLDGSEWTMPIVFQSEQAGQKDISGREYISLQSPRDESFHAVIKSPVVEEIQDMHKVAQGWFGTDDNRHPGVKEFFARGNCIISGKVLLTRKHKNSTDSCYELTPRQTRGIFSQNGWSNVVAFHTRNVPHRGHEYIQLKALEDSKGDAIFISPVTGIKKTGDFLSRPIIECYNELIRSNFYGSSGAVIGAFDTYSRYCGPREAVFTAICRKNYGCNYFIVGRDHTGVGDFYAPDASLKAFDSLNLGINILSFETVSSVNDVTIMGIVSNPDENQKIQPISGSAVRDCLVRGEQISSYLMRDEISKILHEMMRRDPSSVFQA